MLRLKTEKVLSKLYKKERKRCYENLDMKNVTDNTKCWKTVIPLFLDKTNWATKISSKKE